MCVALDYIPRAVDINGAIERFSVKQYDKDSRAIYITLTDSDNPNERIFNLTDHTAALWCKLPSGECVSVAGSVEDADSGRICFILPESVTAEIGIVEAEAVISDADTEISLRTFKFEVLPSLRTPN